MVCPDVKAHQAQDLQRFASCRISLNLKLGIKDVELSILKSTALGQVEGDFALRSFVGLWQKPLGS